MTNPHQTPNHLPVRNGSPLRTNDNRQTIDILIFKLKKMELTKQHREALLTQLDEAEKDLELAKSLFGKGENSELSEWFEIGHFLAIEKIKTIKNSLIQNEIDY